MQQSGCNSLIRPQRTHIHAKRLCEHTERVCMRLLHLIAFDTRDFFLVDTGKV